MLVSSTNLSFFVVVVVVKLCDFFSKLLSNPNSSDSLIVDIFSIFSHLSRNSEDIVSTVIKILKSTSSSTSPSFYIIIKSLNGNATLKSRCCNMIGNLMKHNDMFYDVLKKNKPIFDSLIKCCQLDELNVRKVK